MHTVSDELTDQTLNRIMAIESRGKLKAKAPTSSAYGPFQFLDGTFMDTVKKHRPDLLSGRSKAQVLALRSDPQIGIELGARFTEDNARALGHGYTDGDLYLAHFLGIGAARKFFHAPSGASAAQLAGEAATRANPSILRGKTVAQVRAWAQRSMETRWEQCGSVDWVALYYHPVRVEHDPIPVDDTPPVKTEENFNDEADDTTADVEDTPAPPKHAPAPEPDDDETPGFLAGAKTLLKSKIAWLAGLLGLGSSGSSVSGDPETQNLFIQLVHRPAFWLVVVSVVVAGVIIYFRWKDHGKGAAS